MVKTANLKDFTKMREIAAGGEGKIYEHPSDKNKVVKIYHQARNSKFADHLVLLSTLGPMFIKPNDIYVDTSAKVLGFDMKYVDFNKYWLFNNLFNKGFCTTNGITKDLKIRLLTKLKMALEHIHQNRIIVGDLNQYNLFFNIQGDILFVDVDSYATDNNMHSGVLLDDIRDWTTTDINDKTDNWAYDILAFWATTYCHPYKWVVPGNKESLEIRVKFNKSILTKIPGIKLPALYEPPQGDDLRQFNEIFSGRRFMVQLGGTYTPISTVIPIHMGVSDKLNIRELHRNVTHINVCDNYVALKLSVGEWGLIETKTQGFTREVAAVTCDELFPANDNYAYMRDNVLYGSRQHDIRFMIPVTDYNNGSLTIIEYGGDMQCNFNINNQLGGIDNTSTPVFAKSIIKRSGLLQNFGGKKYLNVPMRNTYSLYPIDNGTKDALFVKGFIAMEIRRKNKTEYIIDDQKNHKGNIVVDYLPTFAVTNTDMVLIPEDGQISVYKDWGLVTVFSCSICTRNSKLYQTNSGIIMLENNTLYLLNTK